MNTNKKKIKELANHTLSITAALETRHETIFIKKICFRYTWQVSLRSHREFLKLQVAGRRHLAAEKDCYILEAWDSRKKDREGY